MSAKNHLALNGFVTVQYQTPPSFFPHPSQFDGKSTMRITKPFKADNKRLFILEKNKPLAVHLSVQNHLVKTVLFHLHNKLYFIFPYFSISIVSANVSSSINVIVNAVFHSMHFYGLILSI